MAPFQITHSFYVKTYFLYLALHLLALVYINGYILRGLLYFYIERPAFNIKIAQYVFINPFYSVMDTVIALNASHAHRATIIMILLPIS